MERSLHSTQLRDAREAYLIRIAQYATSFSREPVDPLYVLQWKRRRNRTHPSLRPTKARRREDCESCLAHVGERKQMQRWHIGGRLKQVQPTCTRSRHFKSQSCLCGHPARSLAESRCKNRVIRSYTVHSKTRQGIFRVPIATMCTW